LRETKALLLAAGLGTRLSPLTDIWPKCLMPIHGRPLLEYWLGILHKVDIDNVLVNTHYCSEYVAGFLQQPQFKDWVHSVYEERLLGTAGTLRENAGFFHNSTVMLAHADNWACCDFSNFLSYHHCQRPKGTVMTMMTFTCTKPSTCGIVELDSNGIVTKFHEKVKNPPSKLANAAVYLIEPEVIEWIENNPEITDFSIEVITQFIGKIATWENQNIHRDIGTVEALKEAQMDKCETPPWSKNNSWQQEFIKHSIHKFLDH
jgi:mannose-1-phosphate guanylyltransferase